MQNILGDRNGVGHGVVKVQTRHASEDGEQAVGCVNEGSKGSRRFQNIQPNNDCRVLSLSDN